MQPHDDFRQLNYANCQYECVVIESVIPKFSRTNKPIKIPVKTGVSSNDGLLRNYLVFESTYKLSGDTLDSEPQ